MGVHRRWKYQKGKGRQLPKIDQRDKFPQPFLAVKYPDRDHGQSMRNLDRAKNQSE